MSWEMSGFASTVMSAWECDTALRQCTTIIHRGLTWPDARYTQLRRHPSRGTRAAQHSAWFVSVDHVGEKEGKKERKKERLAGVKSRSCKQAIDSSLMK